MEITTVQTVTGEIVTNLHFGPTDTLDKIYHKAHPRDKGTFPHDLHISFYYDGFRQCSAGERERPPRRSEQNDFRFGGASELNWGDEHENIFLNLVLCLISEDGNMTGGNLTEAAWGSIKRELNDKMNSNFEIEYLQDHLRGYMQLYSSLEEKRSPVINWDRERKVIIARGVDAWAIQPELQVLHGRQYIPYFDTLKAVYQRLRSSMKITVQTEIGELITLDCDPTDTLEQIYYRAHPHVVRTLLPYAVHISFYDNGVIFCAASAGEIERPRQRSELNDPCFGDTSELKWGHGHDQTFLNLVWKLTHEDGNVTGGNLTEEAWVRIKRELNDEMKSNVEIEFLQDRLCKFMQVYSLLEEKHSPVLNWDRERKVFFARGVGSWADLVTIQPELDILHGHQSIPYFDCLLAIYRKLNTSPSGGQQQVADRDVQQAHVKKVWWWAWWPWTSKKK